MNKVFLIAILSTLVACSPADTPRDSTGRVEKSLPEVCLNGVVYYGSRGTYHTSYSPKFKPDSTVETCE